MKNKLILVLGCQRSGTTLLNLILDSHPQIHDFNEIVLFPINEIIAMFKSGELNLNNLKQRDFIWKQTIFLNLLRKLTRISGSHDMIQNATGNHRMLPFKFTDSFMTSFVNDVINSHLINSQFDPYISFQIPTYSANFN